MRARHSLSHAAFSGRLTADWRARQPTKSCASDLLNTIIGERQALWRAMDRSRGKAYPLPLAPTQSGASLPPTWVNVRLEQIGIIESGQTPKGIETVVASSGEIPWFKVSSMNDARSDGILSESSWWVSKDEARKLGLHVRPAGTIVFPKRGGAIATNKKRQLGRPGAYDLNVMGFIPAPSVADYCLNFFKHLDLSTISDGSNVPQINYFDVADLLVGLPPADELEVVTSLLSEGIEGIDSLAEDVRLAATSLTDLRQSILAAAFRGELV
jgi:type I restriction enzyme S subunit